MESSAIARLTEREKDCLRRWLAHQTAKEMALDLGISPHAVEKRLKMARTKLGVSSSLEAARLVAEAEGYQQPGPQLPDLAPYDTKAEGSAHRNLLVGAIVMTFLVAAVAAVALQAPNAAQPDPMPTDAQGQPTVSDGRPIVYDTTAPADFVTPSPAEIAMVVTNTFSVMDRNHSGFIEAEETPVPGDGVQEQIVFRRDKDGIVREIGVRRVSAEQARAQYVATADKNGDGKLDFAEYREWMVPLIAKHGIPAKWREDMNTHYAASTAN